MGKEGKRRERKGAEERSGEEEIRGEEIRGEEREGSCKKYISLPVLRNQFSLMSMKRL